MFSYTKLAQTIGGIFSPSQLFASGEQGTWYDPSDFSSMYQDSAGTTPVTAVEQPVGKILDKSGNGNHATQSTTTSRPILRNLYNMLICQTTMATQNVTTQATSYTLRFDGTGTVTLSGTATGTKSAGSNTFTATAGTLTLTVSGTVSSAMLTPANESSIPFQSVTSNTLGSGVYDSDVTKFPPYLYFDGTDDFLVTGNINFSATDKVSVFAGVRKLSDTLNQVIIESENWVKNGAFSVVASALYTTRDTYEVGLQGTSLVARGDKSFVAPISTVITVLLDIGAPTKETEIITRYNGAAPTSTSWYQTGAGTGNFVSSVYYIGRRSGTTFPLNGRIYSLITRGALTTTPLLEKTEQWVATKTGVTL